MTDATSSPRQVTKIHKAWVLPLSRCLNDKSSALTGIDPALLEGVDPLTLGYVVLRGSVGLGPDAGG